MISVAPLLETAKRKTGGGGPAFESLFVESVNQVSADLRREAYLDIDDIDTPSTEIDLDTKYLAAYQQGVIYYLYQSGEWAKKPEASASVDYDRSLAMAQYEAIQDEDPESGIPESD